VNSSSHSVNGDIAIQWEWSKFYHSQNPNPWADFDPKWFKTRGVTKGCAFWGSNHGCGPTGG